MEESRAQRESSRLNTAISLDLAMRSQIRGSQGGRERDNEERGAKERERRAELAGL